MAEITILKGVAREPGRSGDARRLRRAGILPASISTESGQAESIQFNLHDFELLLQQHAAESFLLELDIDGKPRRVLLKEVQHDPLYGKVLHADFVEISMTQKIRVQVVVKLIGEPVGVSQEGGLLDHLVREIEIECLASDVIEEVSLDVSELEIGHVRRVADLSVDDKVEIVTGQDVAIASVSAPRVEEEAEPEVEEGEEAAGPEVIGEKTDDDDDAPDKKPSGEASSKDK